MDRQELVTLLASWKKLTVDGLMEKPETFTFAQLLGLPAQDQTTDFHCVEGWSFYDVPWTGIPDRAAGPGLAARQVRLPAGARRPPGERLLGRQRYPYAGTVPASRLRPGKY